MEVTVLPSFLLALREGIEAALIIGIVIGALRKIDRPDLSKAVWAGTACAVVVSLLAAIILNLVGASLEGTAEEVYEGIAMLVAAGVLTWMIFWMNRQARHLRSDLENGVRRAALQTGQGALFLLAFTAVVREGIELALFLTASALASTAQATVIGALLGLGTAILLGWLLFTGILRLDLRIFFQVTGVLLILFAAGLVAHGVHEFNELGWIPPIIEHVWDLNPLLAENSPFGQLLTALLGYNANPSLSEILAYLAYFTAIFLGLRWANSPTRTATQEA
jgi:high-affinity iron transporter